jgi:hypothetical protein
MACSSESLSINLNLDKDRGIRCLRNCSSLIANWGSQEAQMLRAVRLRI